jgi:hypothetical protein
VVLSEQGVLAGGAGASVAADVEARPRRGTRWLQAAVQALPALSLVERAWDRRWMTRPADPNEAELRFCG